MLGWRNIADSSPAAAVAPQARRASIFVTARANPSTSTRPEQTTMIQARETTQAPSAPGGPARPNR